jgi:hypothetical protein
MHSRIEETHDGLRVRVGPRRLRAAVVFTCVWILGWSAAGVAIPVELGGEVHPVFFAVWVPFWAVTEAAVGLVLAWELVGREVLVVGPGALEHRRELGRFARVRTYDLADVVGVGGVAVFDEGEDGFSWAGDFGIELSAAGKVFVAGGNFTAPEADYLASVISDRLHRQTGGRIALPLPAIRPEETRKMTKREWAAALATLALVIGLLNAVAWLVDHWRV